MSWLKDHIECFVEPVLGVNFSREPLGYFKPEELTVIKNTWRSVKKAAEGSPVLLAGRDVFVFEILAQREGYPSLFMPEISRLTVEHIVIPNLQDYFLFDTGFVGSIPRNLGLAPEAFKLLSYRQNAGGRLRGASFDTTTQIFPRLTFSRGLALRIESTPKYWECARMGNGEVIQRKSPSLPFEEAARLTIEIYTNSAAKFIPRHKPMLRTLG